jgi:hypothetical protein
VTTQYIPQHLHTSECLELVAAHEAARGSAYDFVVKIRPDSTSLMTSDCLLIAS